MKKILSNLVFQVLVAIILGSIVGINFPAFAIKQHFIGNYFIGLMEWLVAPVIFLSITSGIAGIASLRTLGGIALKSFILFQLLSTFAIVFGFEMARLLKPGVIDKAILQDIVPHHSEFSDRGIGANSAIPLHNILFVLILALTVGLVLHFLPKKVYLINLLEQVKTFVFKLIGVFLRLSPIAVFSSFAYHIANFGPSSILPMSKLIAVMYLLILIFVFGILGLLLRYFRLSIWELLVLIREEILIVFGTSSSRSVIPLLITRLEKYGCSRALTGFVLSIGYSFNLIGTSIYLGLCTMFLLQLYNIHVDIEMYFKIVIILMLVSKGASGVPGAGFIALSSAIYMVKIIPAEGLLFIVAVDRFLNEARAVTNSIGNAACTLAIAKSEGDVVGRRRKDGI